MIADDLTDEQIKAFRLADNKTHELSEWDFDLLDVELDGIFDIDMSLFGFENKPETEEAVEDDFDVEKNLPDNPISKPGDIWQLGRHRLMCGDSTKFEDVTTLMDGLNADLIVTDPPYNMNYVGSGGWRRNGIMNDNMSDSAFEEFVNKVFINYMEVMKEGASGYCFYKELGNGTFINAVKQSGLRFKQQCVWIKNQAVLGGSLYQGMHEPFIMFCKKTVSKWYGKRKQKSVIENIDLMTQEELIKAIKKIQSSDFDMLLDIVRDNKPLKSALHPTMKPIRLLSKLICNSSDKDDIVLDTFGGSGSTLIACEQFNRICYMMELDPKYADVIIKRWEEFTGGKAAKIN